MSKVIDERTVSMSFDNKKFTEGVKDTLSKLKKLMTSLMLRRNKCIILKSILKNFFPRL